MKKDIEYIADDSSDVSWFNPFQIPETSNDGKLILSIDYSQTVIIKMWDEINNKIGYFFGWFRYDLDIWVICYTNNRMSISLENLTLLNNKNKTNLFEWVFIPKSSSKFDKKYPIDHLDLN